MTLERNGGRGEWKRTATRSELPIPNLERRKEPFLVSLSGNRLVSLHSISIPSSSVQTLDFVSAPRSTLCSIPSFHALFLALLYLLPSSLFHVKYKPPSLLAEESNPLISLPIIESPRSNVTLKPLLFHPLPTQLSFNPMDPPTEPNQKIFRKIRGT